ncbi:hypothetical protein JW949_02455 [Candidatus Woesearchaeota archaeon]|nr:hypothetical protein [Candidatus Woesearchaeota archaeon]
MINVPFDKIKEKIKQESGLSAEEIDKRIKDKMQELSGLVSKEGAAHIIANELKIDLIKTDNLKIKDLLSGMRNIEITGKVMDKYELREFDTGERKGKVANFLLGDETGVTRVVLWNENTGYFSKFEKNDILKIKGAFVKDNQGRKELSLSSQDSKIEINPEGVTVNVSSVVSDNQYPEAKRKKLEELKEDDTNIEVLGTIVQIYDPRFFEVCPKCNKRVRIKEDKYVCNEHGAVEPNYNYVMNIYLDDGSENIRTVFWSRQIEKLLSKSRDEILAFRDNIDNFASVKQELLGKMIKIVGDVKKNDNFDRMELVAKLVFPDPDPEEEIEKLDKAVEKTEETEEKEIEDEASGEKETKNEPEQPEEKPETKEETATEETKEEPEEKAEEATTEQPGEKQETEKTAGEDEIIRENPEEIDFGDADDIDDDLDDDIDIDDDMDIDDEIKTLDDL